MGGGFEQQEGGGAEAQDVHHLGRRGLGQERLQHGVERAHAAQHGGGKAMTGGTVAGLDAGLGIERLLERAAAIKHGTQQIEGRLAGWVAHGVSGSGGRGAWDGAVRAGA